MRKKARSLIFYKTSVVLDDNDFLPGLNCETVTSYTVFHYFSVNVFHPRKNAGTVYQETSQG